MKLIRVVSLVVVVPLVLAAGTIVAAAAFGERLLAAAISMTGWIVVCCTLASMRMTT